MKVYKLIQELAKYPESEQVKLKVWIDDDTRVCIANVRGVLRADLTDRDQSVFIDVVEEDSDE